MEQVHIGDELYLVDSGNRARHRGRRPCQVMKVGREYFTVAFGNHGKVQFHLDSWRQKTDYLPDYTLYKTQQAYEDEVLFERLRCRLRQEVEKRTPSFTLEQLRQAMDILNLAVEGEVS